MNLLLDILVAVVSALFKKLGGDSRGDDKPPPPKKFLRSVLQTITVFAFLGSLLTFLLGILMVLFGAFYDGDVTIQDKIWIVLLLILPFLNLVFAIFAHRPIYNDGVLVNGIGMVLSVNLPSWIYLVVITGRFSTYYDSLSGMLLIICLATFCVCGVLCLFALRSSTNSAHGLLDTDHILDPRKKSRRFVYIKEPAFLNSIHRAVPKKEDKEIGFKESEQHTDSMFF